MLSVRHALPRLLCLAGLFTLAQLCYALPNRIVPAAPEAVIIKQTAMVPLRVMAELLGGHLTAQGQHVTLALDAHRVTFTVGSTQATANDQQVALSLPPFSRCGTTFVPLRPLITALGGTLAMEYFDVTQVHVPTNAGMVALHLPQSSIRSSIAEFIETDTELYVCHLDGSGLQRLTYNSDENTLPCISSDGTRLAYGYRDRLYLRALSEPHERVLCAWTNSLFSIDPCFSPDGKTVLFSQKIGVDTWLCSVNIDGTAYRQLVKGEYGRFSPDGTFIAYLHTDPVGGTKLYKVNPDGSGMGAYRKAVSLAFSSDGRYLQFSIPTDDGKYVRHTFSYDDAPRIPESAPFTEAAMSIDEVVAPDLSRVVFSRFGDCAFPAGIYMTDSNRTYVRRLTSNPEDRHPAFTADMSHITFIRNNNLYVMDIDGTHLQQLTRGLQVCNYMITPDGQHLLLSAAPEASEVDL